MRDTPVRAGALADLGQPRRGPQRLAVVVGVVATLGAAATVFVVSEAGRVADDRRAWPRSGVPCPVLQPASAARTLAERGLRVRYRFRFEGVTFGRTFGDVACHLPAVGPWGASEPVCRFTSPAFVEVSTSRGEALFLPGVGRTTTVFSDPDGPKCYAQSGDTGLDEN
jgi:hypothetical protein